MREALRGTSLMRAALVVCLTASMAARAVAHELPGKATLYSVNAAIGAGVVLISGLLDQRPWRQVLRETGWGALGGAVDSWGKDRAFHLEHDPTAGLQAKLLVSIGTSVIEDAAAGRQPGSTLSADVGPAYLTWHRGKGWAPQVRLLPAATVALGATLFEPGISLDGVSTLRTLTPVFTQRGAFHDADGGRQLANTLVLAEPRGHALSQELAHALQYRQAFILQQPIWDDTVRASWWKLDVGELMFAGAEQLVTGRGPGDREALAETEADALELLHGMH